MKSKKIIVLSLIAFVGVVFLLQSRLKLDSQGRRVNSYTTELQQKKVQDRDAECLAMVQELSEVDCGARIEIESEIENYELTLWETRPLASNTNY